MARIKRFNESKITISKKYKYSILELGENPTPEEIIKLWNDLFEDIEISYFDGKFFDVDNKEVTLDNIFFLIDDYLR